MVVVGPGAVVVVVSGIVVTGIVVVVGATVVDVVDVADALFDVSPKAAKAMTPIKIKTIATAASNFTSVFIFTISQ